MPYTGSRKDAELPEKVIGDKAYDSDKLDKQLVEERGVELISPHK